MDDGIGVEPLEAETGWATDYDELICCLHERPPRVPPRFGYDSLGSQLFEEITALPDYYLTRVEDRLLRHHAGEIADQVVTPWIVELGSGSGRKTRTVLAACASRRRTMYLPVDVSRDMLVASCDAFAADASGVAVQGLWGRYEAGLGWIRKWRHGPITIMLLGSTLGNATPDERRALLAEISGTLQPGDRFLVSADLIKPAPVFEAGYNDPPGYSAFERFRLNHLTHLNRRFDGDFVTDRFHARAHYNDATATVEGYLYATTEQAVTLRELETQLTLEKGDRINVGFSVKFDAADFAAELDEFELAPVTHWVDPDWSYGLFLFCRR